MKRAFLPVGREIVLFMNMELFCSCARIVLFMSVSSITGESYTPIFTAALLVSHFKVHVPQYNIAVVHVEKNPTKKALSLRI